jgi:CubicO group peptidase (beta-lactamase class C family)
MEAAARIIQTQVDAGALESAVLDVGQGSDRFERAFGKAGTTKAMFLLGSITKPFTAVATMVLADRGELRLADRVMKFIPEFSEGDRMNVTIEHLLTHTSGLPDQLAENNALRARHAPLSEFVRATVRAPLLFAPGKKYHYQSMGILLAGEIVERVTKRTLPEFLAKEVFTPLGMRRTVLGLGKFEKADMVQSQTAHAAPESGGGDPKARDWDWNSDYWRRLAAPWGGAHSTTADLTIFLRRFLHPDGRVLREQTARLMVQNHTEGLEARRGLGFALGPAGFGKGCSEKAFGHSGSTGTLAWADPATDTTCVILTSLPSRASINTVLHPVSELAASRD